MFSARLDLAHVSSVRLNSMCLRQWEQRQRDVERENSQSTPVVPQILASYQRNVLSGEIVYFCQRFHENLDFERRKHAFIYNKTNRAVVMSKELIGRRAKKFVVSVSAYLYIMTDLT